MAGLMKVPHVEFVTKVYARVQVGFGHVHLLHGDGVEWCCMDGVLARASKAARG